MSTMDIFLQYILPWTSAGIAGYAAGYFRAQERRTRGCLGAALHVLIKMRDRGVYISPFDRAILNTAHQHYARIK